MRPVFPWILVVLYQLRWESFITEDTLWVECTERERERTEWSRQRHSNKEEYQQAHDKFCLSISQFLT